MSGGKISQTTFVIVTYAVVKSFNRYAIIVTLYVLRSGRRKAQSVDTGKQYEYRSATEWGVAKISVNLYQV